MKPKYVKLGKEHGPHFIDGCCVRCGKPLKGEGVCLELDTRTDEYHDFGVPEEFSQGGFDFGPGCAKILRDRATAAAKR